MGNVYKCHSYKANFDQAELYQTQWDEYLIIPICEKETGRWTITWLESESLLEPTITDPFGGFDFLSAQEAIAAAKTLIDHCSEVAARNAMEDRLLEMLER
ncbi:MULTISPECIES: hypothetical protein [unclassified Coleofasciculus]|uniref:hypothetical protein n=1 Tax=unclassified Coleofasciculus TaxID=2692782 RepID=UPI0018826DF9|nr:MULTISPECIES: hypothetical protein [unclassified Coleofasciculus]MBE9129213.1 hypothetical protein [Coleofasciculus sp. LEGE 07081]MBE9151887.1 hypothetical protein [Coleofasciculus sp. LEGE 07092]